MGNSTLSSASVAVSTLPLIYNDTVKYAVEPELDASSTSAPVNKYGKDSAKKDSLRAGVISDLASAGIIDVDDKGNKIVQSVKSLSTAPIKLDEEWLLDFKSGVDKLSSLGHLALDLDSKSLSPGVDTDQMKALAERAAMSYTELCRLTEEGLDTIKAQYLDVYQNVIKKFETFYRDFQAINSGVFSYFTPHTDDKGNTTHELNPELLEKMNVLINSYSSGDKGVLYPVSGTATQEDAKKWATELGLPDHCVESSGSGYVVRVDLTALKDIRNNLEEMKNSGSISAFQLSAWKSGFDGQVTTVNTTLQSLSNRYGSAQGVYDTAVKMFSSLITSLADSIRQILASF
ncbi:IpaD/SipD/SspD family type III secretion system needle tip protein [Sodalis sp. dw_96]|uniref:IpaD/SipD/SspD family type III secretion system needle tip protein n=1 Tax=Sodalis sp. dw_96 TaxID=2719794 RepID=UPI001BD5ECA7|nr:IpaD/SipD/SspD family type III secretion system needle tip protein [Sodalis sp. dw_96]